MREGRLTPVTRRQHATIALLLVLLALAGAAAISSGPGGLAFDDPELLGFRAFRAIAAAVVGLALGAAGVVLQSMMRNPLASPDLLGVAGGAGLAMSLAAYFAGLSGNAAKFAWAGPWATAAAVLGALAALTLVYVLGRRKRGLDPATVILVGVVVGILSASLTQLLQQLMPPEQGRSAASAFLGGIRENELGWAELSLIAALTLACVTWAAFLGPAMDASAMGDDEAISVGVSLPRLRISLFIVAGVLSAGAVVIAGPIGFVGLICPHFIRLASGPRHRGLVIGASLACALLVLGADTFVRLMPLQTGRLPLSVITAVIGGPVLVHMLRSRNGRIA